jgi:hypothetical protein
MQGGCGPRGRRAQRGRAVRAAGQRQGDTALFASGQSPGVGLETACLEHDAAHGHRRKGMGLSGRDQLGRPAWNRWGMCEAREQRGRHHEGEGAEVGLWCGCCTRTVDSPKVDPTEKRKRKQAANSRGTGATQGMTKAEDRTETMTRFRKGRAACRRGCLPARISAVESGETRSWSKVPIVASLCHGLVGDDEAHDHASTLPIRFGTGETRGTRGCVDQLRATSRAAAWAAWARAARSALRC